MNIRQCLTALVPAPHIETSPDLLLGLAGNNWLYRYVFRLPKLPRDGRGAAGPEMVQSCRSGIPEQLTGGHLTLQIHNGAAQLTHRERHDSDIENGAAEGTRTPDPIITNDVLYQLSYSGTFLVWLCYDRGNVKSTPARRTLCQVIGGGEIRRGSCRPVVRVRVFRHGLDG